MSEKIKNAENNTVLDEAIKRKNAPNRMIELIDKFAIAAMSSIVGLATAGALGVVLFFTLGLPWAIGGAVTLGVVSINENFVAGLYNKKIKKMLDKYPELDGMDKEALAEESERREVAFEEWNKLEDKDKVSFKEYLKRENEEVELPKNVVDALEDDKTKENKIVSHNSKSVEEQKVKDEIKEEEKTLTK